MPDCDTVVQHRYSAFISYSHADASFARKLHRRLEGYRLPRRLLSARVDASRRLAPIFRDQDELAATPDLSAAVKFALAESQYLIVICSSHAEASEWVALEVALFRELHGEQAVLAVIAEGCPETSFRKLLCGTGPGVRRIEPLASDFRHHGDGRSLAFLKLIAVLADVRLDALIQRDAQRHIRRLALASGSALAGAVFVGTMMLMAIYEHNKANESRLRAEAESRVAELQLERSEALVKHQRDEVRNKLMANGRIDILNSLDNGTAEYYKSGDVAQLSTSDQEEYAKVLLNIGQDDEAAGDLDDASKQFQEAYRLTAKLLSQDNADWRRIYAHAQSEYWMGEYAWRIGQYGMAEKKFDRYLTLADQLVARDGNNPDGLTERAYAQSNLGTFFLRSKIDLYSAEKYYLKSLVAFRAVHALRPDDTVVKNIADMYEWLGDVRRLRRDCSGASSYRDNAHQLLIELQQRNPSSVFKYALIADKLALARIDLCKGDWSAALAELERGHADAMALADNDPKNLDRRGQVRIFELFQASIWLNLPTKARPNQDVIVRALGSCPAEALLRNNIEIAQYCYILQARNFKQVRRPDDANTSLRAAESLAPIRDGELSPDWGLNLQQEVDLVSKIHSDEEGRNE